MKRTVTLFLFFFALVVHAQNDLCANATTLTPNVSCTGTPGSFNGSLLDGTASACAPNASQDVWYQFVATDRTMLVSVSNSINIGLDVAMEIYSGSCAGTLVTCQNAATATQGYEGYFNTNFVVGQRYYVRILNTSSNSSTQNFSVCVQKYPTPSNDLCANATVLTPNLNCTNTAGSFSGSFLDGAVSACAPNASQDVWYQFVATDRTMLVSVGNSINIGLDVAMEIYSGTCSGTLVTCQNVATASQGYEGYFNNNFVVGQTYYVRILNTSSNISTQNFSVCIQKYPTPSNDLCADAATINPSPSCTGTPGSFGGTLFDGNVSACASNASQDIWYKFVASDPTLYVEASNSINIGLDVAIEIYSASCGGTLLTCQNAATASQGYEGYSGTGFVVGQTYYLRVLNVSQNLSTANFSVCVQGPVLNTEEPVLKTVSIAPNPVKNVLQISNLNDFANFSYQIVTIQGQIIGQDQLTQNAIATDHLAKGFYILRLFDNTKEVKIKFVKE